MVRQTTERGKFFTGKTPRPTAERTTSREAHPGATINQISFALACIEEGPHITRVIRQLTSHQEIPQGTNVLITISDNGSRGAWKLIEGASQAQAMQTQLSVSFQRDPHLSEDFAELTAAQKRLRSLQYQETQTAPITSEQERNTVQTQLSETAQRVSERLSPQQRPLFEKFLDVEAMHRADLLLAMKNPEELIHQTDALHPPLIPNQQPTARQKDTLRIYAEMLSGKYDELKKRDIRIKLASGSETGNFGSVKETARIVATQDYIDGHPEASPKSHVIFIGDIDTHFPKNKLITGLVEVFSKNPDAPAVRANLGLAWDSQRRPGTVIPLPIPTELGDLFGDTTNFGAFFHAEGRQPSHIVPRGQGLSGLFGYPNLLIGPALILRGDEPGIEILADQGEDLERSARLHRDHPGVRLPRHSKVRIGFNTRGAQHNPLDLITNFHTAITPYWHQQWEKLLGHDAHMKFRQDIFGYGHRLPLVGKIIRSVEEERYNLSPNEYVGEYLASHSGRFRRTLSTVPGERKVPSVWDAKTGYHFSAVIRNIPSNLLSVSEYAARELTPAEELKKRDSLYRGEKILHYNGKAFLIRTHLQPKDSPDRHISIATT